MAKKRSRDTRQTKKQAQAPSKKKSNPALPAVVVLAVLLAAGGIYYFNNKPVRSAGPNPAGSTAAAHQLQETRPTLSPDLFSGTVRKAYTIAREIPEVLDQLYCYCRCKENFNHLNLLTCYTDNHAAT